MGAHLTPVMKGAIAFAYVGGIGFFLLGVYLTVRRRRLHPLLLVSISAISFSWIEAPYDWAMYAQFAPAIPRMPHWWLLNMTWGGLPASVPPGYISYFVLPALLGAALGRRLSARFGWRRPTTLLATGLVVGFVWAFLFNAILGARLGIFYYGRVIPGLALWQGSKHQYPLYDAVAMGVQMMVFCYLLGRTDPEGRTVVEAWARRRTTKPIAAPVLAVVGVVLIGNLTYGAVFAPHLVAKLQGWETAGPTGRLFPGVPNQPLNGTDRGPRLGAQVGHHAAGVLACRPGDRRTGGVAKPVVGTLLASLDGGTRRQGNRCPSDTRNITTSAQGVWPCFPATRRCARSAGTS